MNLALPDTLHASKNTEWKFTDSKNFCILKANNSGVKLSIFINLPLSNNNTDTTFITIDRPGLFNKIFNSDIHWPRISEWDDDDDIFAIFFSMDPKKIYLPSLRAEGGSDLRTYGKDNDEVYDFSRYLIKYKNVEVYKNYDSKTGYSTTRLGRWSASSSLGQKALSNFAKCVSK